MGKSQVPAPSLALTNVSVRFAGLVALDDVSFQVVPAQVFGLIGPNGAGKTTAVNVLTGYLKPTTGGVFLDGASVEGHGPEAFAKGRILRTFQSGRLFPRLPVIDNVASAAVGVQGMARAAARLRAFEILEWLKCAAYHAQNAGDLPHGIQQRVGVARALAGAPRYLLLDEPASGLGRADCDELVSLIRQIPTKFGCGVLLIEHNMSVIMNACSRIHVLNSGKSLAEGTPAEMQRNPAVKAAYLGEAAHA